MRELEKHQTYLKRIENFPLEKAKYYQSLKESTGVKSVRALSEITGEDWSYIAKILRIPELPPPIQEYLKTHKEPTMVKHFHLKRLIELARLNGENAQFARFREIIDEIDNDQHCTTKHLLKTHLSKPLNFKQHLRAKK